MLDKTLILQLLAQKAPGILTSLPKYGGMTYPLENIANALSNGADADLLTKATQLDGVTPFSVDNALGDYNNGNFTNMNPELHSIFDTMYKSSNPTTNGIPMSSEDLDWSNDSELDNIMADSQGDALWRMDILNKYRKK